MVTSWLSSPTGSDPVTRLTGSPIGGQLRPKNVPVAPRWRWPSSHAVISVRSSAGNVSSSSASRLAGSDHAGRGVTAATVAVINNTFAEFGLADLAGELPCFVNLTRDFLTGRLPLPFGPEHAVLEG